MGQAPLAERLAGIREAARRREEAIRQRIEWVEARQRELWSRQDRQAARPAPPRIEYSAPKAPAAEPVRQVQARRYDMPPPSLAPRPAEVLLARFRDILVEANALMHADSATDEPSADTRQMVVAEP